MLSPLGLRLPSLDARLKTAVQMAKNTAICADIGADHGRLSVALLAQGRAEHVLVSDVSEKSLLKAKRLLCSHGLEDKVTFAVADGLRALDALDGKAVDTVFILGMGGETLKHILVDGAQRLHGAELILGAQTDLPLLRQAICDVGYRIREEQIAQENGRSYVLMRCTQAVDGEPSYDERELLLGPALLRELPTSWKPVLERRKKLLVQAVAAMETAPRDQGSRRLAVAKRELHYVEETLKRYEQNGTN